ncbi:hypothetical protein [Sinorhizobium meliloti]|uniref:hypothetical protein n=1 Tax=Rhizobium meliloti TaxID=382 RepID=UPI001D1267D1|nr:hypothetical protein [Sinorhizobium meliloti]MDE4601388.1 hypothetical protein [Sinorhizobium meliloti]UDU20988.1 hypothetical protein LJD24_08520 [Sinorhizobium meliloti]
MRRFGVLLLGLLAGCATNGPYPVNVAGNYYMAGGPECVSYRPHNTEKRILCHDAKGRPTFQQRALTAQEMQIYQQAQAAANSAYVYQPQPMPVMNYPVMQTPQVMPITPPGGNQVRCISTGFYTNCRD